MKIFKEISKYIGLIGALVIALLIYKIISNFTYIKSSFNDIISIISPFIYAFIIAYLLNPIVKFFNNRLNIKNYLSILITYAILILIVILTSVYFTPKIIDSFKDLYVSFPQAINQVETLISSISANTSLEENPFLNSFINSDLNSIITQIKEAATTVSNYVLKGTISTTILIGKWILGFLISIYVLIYKYEVISFFKKLLKLILKEDYAHKTIDFFRTLDSMFMLYIVVKGLTSLLIGSIAFVGLTIIGSPYAILISVFVAITNMIPYFGPFLGMVFGSLITLIFLPQKTLLVLVFLFLLQQFDAFYLYPKTVGERVGLNPLVVIFSVIVGGGLYGPIGMVLSVPIVASFMVYFNKYLE
ncbi:MAG: AI-2E family transporter [Clostridium sp.]|uniref:AI-2E family transporter n=1 Tax=Clostridium sp. TaxID=1506 RepID=UPI002FCBAAEF